MSQILLQAMPSDSTAMNKASRNATVTSMMVCCGFVVCWSANQIYYLLSFIGYKTNYPSWFYHFCSVKLSSLFLQTKFLMTTFCTCEMCEIISCRAHIFMAILLVYACTFSATMSVLQA